MKRLTSVVRSLSVLHAARLVQTDAYSAVRGGAHPPAPLS